MMPPLEEMFDRFKPRERGESLPPASLLFFLLSFCSSEAKNKGEKEGLNEIFSLVERARRTRRSRTDPLLLMFRSSSGAKEGKLRSLFSHLSFSLCAAAAAVLLLEGIVFLSFFLSV